MKKLTVLLLVSLMSFTICGCGAKGEDNVNDKENSNSKNENVNDDVEDEEELAGADWQTWGYYHEIEWFTPDGTETIWATYMEEPAGLIFNKDTEAYNQICSIYLHNETIEDLNYIYDNISCEDLNDDGYGDLIVYEIEGDTVYKSVYLWNSDTEGFEASEELSGFEIESDNTDSNTENDSENDIDLTIEEKIVAYYMDTYEPEGTYVIFEEENFETDTAIVYTLRYQISDEEAEEILNSGDIPTANIYVTSVAMNKETGECVDDWGTILPIE